jgi:hypothetical protein
VERRYQMLAAVEPFTEEWTPTERAMAAARLDILNGVGAYVCLVAVWGLDTATDHGSGAEPLKPNLFLSRYHEVSKQRKWVAQVLGTRVATGSTDGSERTCSTAPPALSSPASTTTAGRLRCVQFQDPPGSDCSAGVFQRSARALTLSV